MAFLTRNGRAVPPAPQATAAQAAAAPARSVAAVQRRSGPLGLRLLPATIFVAALMLSVRVVDIFDGRDPAVEIGVGGAPAEAQAVPPTPPDGKPGTEGGAAPAAAEAAPPAPAAPAPAPDRPIATDAFRTPEVPSGSEGAEPIDVSKLTRGEVAVLQRLSERRRELDERQARVDERERLLAAMETRIDDKIAQLRSIQTEIESLLGKVSEAQESEYQRLVRIYEAMEPEDAARIFQGLDLPVLMQVMERMKERRTAPILAQMDPVRAREVTTELAERRKLPPGAEGAVEGGTLATPAAPGNGN